ncbi:MAG TPA: polyprenol phosphomannose-dependent alpha 1,6 mannosyltransferase MptB [Acidimicrobiales bacterium]|nr:polyprenol phosphomannose-dependent alpha 1,6 mannosyltransferase MptB [Acidimicrobiales bacterium]
MGPTLLGVVGSVFLAVGSDLPGSPYGPHAGGLWPFAGRGPAPGWEGPSVPEWTMVARNQGAGVGPGRLLATAAVVVGVGLLGWAWLLVWRAARGEIRGGRRSLWWTAGAWVAPLMFAAPFASQDVWTYGAEGKMVLSGFGGYRPATMLGHSVWTLGVDPKWIELPSPYGPGALDLSAVFVRISGGRPWVAAECWRLMSVIGLVLCAWGVTRIVSMHGGDGTAAAVAAVANPAILLILVAGIHNDALMLGLVVAGMAVALSGRRTVGLVLCALGVAVKPNALLVVGALAWWAWGSRWRHRTRGILVAALAVAGVLAVGGLAVGGGFGWVRADLFSGEIAGPWSFAAQLFHSRSGWPVDAVEFAGFALAIAFVVGPGRPGGWIAGLGWGFAVMAVTVPRPEPWYVAWAVVLLACGGLRRHSERLGILVLSAMLAGSVLPLEILWWFEGVFALVWLGLVSLRANPRADPTSPADASDGSGSGDDDDHPPPELAPAGRRLP